MNNRKLHMVLFLIGASFFYGVSAQAEIMCPTSLYIDVPANPDWNLVVGPDAAHGSGYTAYPSKIISKLSKNKSICKAPAPTYRSVPIVHKNITLSSGKDDGVKYLDHDPTDDYDCSGWNGVPCDEYPAYVPTQIISIRPNTRIREDNLYIERFDCADQSRVRMEVSSGAWHDVVYSVPATDVSMVEVASNRGQPRRFDVTCHYAFPKTVGVNFPRQFGEGNRDISVNLKKTGFYRVYDMNNNLWGKVCNQRCGETVQCSGCGTGDAYGSAADAYANNLQQCKDKCVGGGW